MGIRVLLVLVVLVASHGCGQSSSAPAESEIVRAISWNSAGSSDSSHSRLVCSGPITLPVSAFLCTY